MELYSWLIENKELLKTIYALVVLAICIIIVIKTDRLFRVSSHQGIRYFRNAFFFYGIAFVIRHFFGGINLTDHSVIYLLVVKSLFEFFMIMAGFFLLYSLIWKRFERARKSPDSSLFNLKLGVFYIMVILLVILDIIWASFIFMFISQILLFFYALLISFKNYQKDKGVHKFLKFYFVAMIFSLIGWTLNALAALYLNWNRGILINIYLINIAIFLLFLYGVIQVTRKNI